MDTGAECNLLPLDVYKKVTGDLHLNFLNARGKSILVLANGDEQPIEGKATVYVSRKGNAHKIEVNVVRGHGYEPILSKQTMLEMNLIKILDSDRDPRVNVLKSDTEPLLEEYDDVFEGLGKLDGQYHIVTDAESAKHNLFIPVEQRQQNFKMASYQLGHVTRKAGTRLVLHVNILVTSPFLSLIV